MYSVPAFIAYQLQCLLLSDLRLLPLDGVFLASVSVGLPFVMPGSLSHGPIFPLLIESDLMRSIFAAPRTIRVNRGRDLQRAAKVNGPVFKIWFRGR